MARRELTDFDKRYDTEKELAKDRDQVGLDHERHGDNYLREGDPEKAAEYYGYASQAYEEAANRYSELCDVSEEKKCLERARSMSRKI